MANKQFQLSGGDEEFASRQKSVFDQLGSISSPSLAAPTPVLDVDLRGDSRSRSSHSSQRRRSAETTRHLRGQESLFKRPEPPPPWRHRGGGGGHRMPDHRKNPQKWTHYSLGDVSNDDMSDRTNTSTALSFLNELRQRREAGTEDDGMDVDRSDEAPVVQFKRPTRKRNDVETFRPDAERSEKGGPLFRGSKRVMPEYVVGQKSSKSAKKAGGASGKDKSGDAEKKSRQMKLMHLMDDEEED